MKLYKDDPKDKNYVIFNKGQLIGIRDASEEIKQISLPDGNNESIGSGGICYVLASIISVAPIIENNIIIKELGEKNGIKRFQVENKVKGGPPITVELRIGKKSGFPKSEKGIDIQVLLEYLKKEIEKADDYLIKKFKDTKSDNVEDIFKDNNIDQDLLDKILIEIADNYKQQFGNFLERNDKGRYKLKDKKGLMRAITASQDFKYITNNLPAFIMSSGGSPAFVSTILTGRPSKMFEIDNLTEKDLETLFYNNIKELNFLTISNEGHAFSINDITKIDGKIFVLIRNPMGRGNENDIDSTESDKILKNIDEKHKYSKFKNSEYKEKGYALLCLEDLKKTFKDMTYVDYQIGKYIFTENISKEQFEKNERKQVDFVIDIKQQDNIKIDITNFQTDFQADFCVPQITIFDEKRNEIQTISFNDLYDSQNFNNKNVLTNIREGKYIIRVDLWKPCNINIIRNNSSNKIKCLGKANDDNFKYCKAETEIKYTKEEEEKNNFIFEKDIHDTVRIARMLEQLYEEPCISQFKKISKDEIIIQGKSILTQKLLYKVVNDIKNKILSGYDEKTKNEIIRVENDKIIFFGIDMTDNLGQKELSLSDEKIGIINDKNEEQYINIKDLESEAYKNMKIQKYIVPSLKLGKDELTIKMNSFDNKDDAIKKLQEIKKINAGLFKDFMTGGVEFEQPIIFKNFIQNFYTYKEHIIAFKCENDAVNDIKNVLKNLLNNDITINCIQEVWETILDELIDGFIIGGCLPFISLHFNEMSLLYSVMNTNYKHTIVGHVLTFIDYFLKGFTNGAFFDEKFVYDWYENQSKFFKNSASECRNNLFKYTHNLFKYVYENKIKIKYITTDGIYEDMLFNEQKQYYLSANRIIGKMSDDKILNFDENILYPEFNFKVEGDLDPLPTLLELLNNNSENNLKWEKTKRAHEIMKSKIKSQMSTLPFLKGYFYLLDMITFAIYYLISIKSLSSLPDISNSIKKKCAKSGKSYLKVVPSVFPPLPTTKYLNKEYEITFEQLINILDFKIKNHINSNIYRILDTNSDEYFNDKEKKDMIKGIETAIINDCYNKYGYEAYIQDKYSLKYLIKYLDEICEDLSFFWTIIINSFKNLIKNLKDDINKLSTTYPDLKSDINNFNSNNSLYKGLNNIKDSINNKLKTEESLYIYMVSIKIISKNLFNSNQFSLQQIEPIAKNIKDNELINQIEKYKKILEINFHINKLIESMKDKNFYDFFKIEKPYKRTITIISVGYHEGSISYRGGCLVDFNQEIELKEKKNQNKNKTIKNAINNKKEEIKINNESYFLVKTRINSLLYDKEHLMEINYSENTNMKSIIHNISINNSNNFIKYQNGLSSNFFKIISNDEQVFRTISTNELTDLDESNETLLTNCPAVSNNKLIIKLINSNNAYVNIQPYTNMITPLLSAISIKNLELSEIIINKGWYINDTTDIKFTPMHFASYYNLPKIVKLLIQKNADVTIKTKKEGEIPLHLACRKGNFEIVKLLLNYNKYTIDTPKSDNKTSLHLASITSSLCTHILLKNNAKNNI